MVKAAPAHARRSQRIGEAPRARNMLLILVCLLAATAAVPVSYDQRQDGDYNFQADFQNILVLIAVPEKTTNLFDIFNRSNKPKRSELQERTDIQFMKAFVEPNTPYQVEIGADRSADGRAVEVVIAGKRRVDSEQPDQDEYKLLGATEQCGPDRIRDPDTLTCKPKLESNVETKHETAKEDKVEIKTTPEVIAS